MSSDEVPSSSEKLPSVSSPRTNGWECPWHPFQVIAWLVVLLFIISHYGFLVFYFPQYWRVIGYIIPGIIIIIHIFSTIITTSINPADNNVRLKLRDGMFKRGMFDRSRHEHVIEDLHCHLCDTDVSKSAKHCRICDKCVNGFDHHCKWLNTCVGKRNYKYFIVTITSGLIGAVFAALISLIFFIIFFASRENLRYFCDLHQNISSCDDTLKILGAAVPDPLFPTATAILFVLAVAATCLLSHLTFFHYYLIYNGISTFDYITSQRKTDQVTKHSNRLCCFEKRINRISPVAMEEGKLDDVVEDVDPDSISNDSAGMMTFSRTPPPLYIEDFENKTQDEKCHENYQGILRSGRSLSHHNSTNEPVSECYPDISETQFSNDTNKIIVYAEIHKDTSHDSSPDLPVESHDNHLSSHNVTPNSLSHDLPVESHDSPLSSHNVTANSHDSPVLSHDLPVESHDVTGNSHDSPVLSHDLPVESHDVTGNSYDSPVLSHGLPVESHDSPSHDNYHDSTVLSHSACVDVSHDIPLETNMGKEIVSSDIMSCDTVIESHDDISNSIAEDEMNPNIDSVLVFNKTAGLKTSQSLTILPTSPSLQKLKKVTFSNTHISDLANVKMDTHISSDMKSLPLVPSRPLPPSPLPLIGDDSKIYSPILLEYTGLGRRPLPPITFEDSVIHVGSHESLTSVQSSHSNTSLSSDPRYQRRTNRHTSSLTSLDSDNDKVIGRNKNKRKKTFPTDNERWSSGSQTLAPLIEY